MTLEETLSEQPNVLLLDVSPQKMVIPESGHLKLQLKSTAKVKQDVIVQLKSFYFEIFEARGTKEHLMQKYGILSPGETMIVEIRKKSVLSNPDKYPAYEIADLKGYLTIRHWPSTRKDDSEESWKPEFNRDIATFNKYKVVKTVINKQKEYGFVKFRLNFEKESEEIRKAVDAHRVKFEKKVAANLEARKKIRDIHSNNGENIADFEFNDGDFLDDYDPDEEVSPKRVADSLMVAHQLAKPEKSITDTETATVDTTTVDTTTQTVNTTVSKGRPTSSQINEVVKKLEKERKEKAKLKSAEKPVETTKTVATTSTPKVMASNQKGADQKKKDKKKKKGCGCTVL